MKKFVAVLSAAAMMTSLAACGSTADTTSTAASSDAAVSTESTAAEATTDAKSYKIAVVQQLDHASLDEIRTLLVYSDHPTGSCEWINALIRTHIEAVTQQIRDLEHLKAHLESLYHKCDGSREGGCGILKSLIDGENCLYCQTRQPRTGQERP